MKYTYDPVAGMDKYGVDTLDYDKVVEFEVYNKAIHRKGILCYGIYEKNEAGLDMNIADVFEEEQAIDLLKRLNNEG
jgi:hypothetical protein